MLRRLSVAAALCVLAAVAPAHAMGLGDIKVKSRLNQRFSAVIPFTSLTPEEAANVRARVADNQDFARAGLDRSGYLSSVRVEAVTDGANPRLELSSGEIAREPLLTLLIEVRKPGGTRMLREYTVLLDPAVTVGGGAPAARAQSSSGADDSDFFQTPEEARGGAAQPRTADASASPRSSSVGTGGLYGPVGEGETLWMIAQAVKPAGVGLDQAMLALFEANPGAFRGGDIDYLRKGARLQVPDADTMQKLSNAASRARVLELSSEIGTGPSVGTGPSDLAMSSALSSSSFPPAAPPPKPAASPGDSEALSVVVPPPAAATPTTGTAPDTAGTTGPAPAPGTTPAGDGAGAAGDVDAEGVVNTETPPAPATAPATGADAAPATQTPPADAPPAEAQGVDVIGWLPKLLPVFIALIVLLIGFVAWRAARERKAQRDYERAARETTRIPAPRMGATGSFPAKGAHSARDELEELGRQIDDDATRVSLPDADEDRTRMVTTSKIPAYVGPTSLASDRPMDEAEMAVTSQFQANTMEIKLGDNDPISEADFHLAYGLYDEAALLLQQASARAPGRAELRVKLAETYFAAGKATEFEQTAGPLKSEVSADEWNKIAIMGRQLVPASDLFAGGVTSSNTDTVLDLTFDDDVAQIVPVKVDEGLEFNLEELELPSKTDQLAAQASQALEFDLGEFDLDGTDKPKKAAPAPANAVLDFKDFDLGGSDILGPGKGELDVRLDDIEPMVIDDPLGDEGHSAGDDATTSLNLARVYVEMGDAEMARSLLDQVTTSGTEEQKREAGQLRERLLG